ncbi:MAG TPA: hypothetical protein VF043_11120 [Ktedonobacteraceae bacterium]
MDTLLNARPGCQHPFNAPKMSLPHARSWPLSCLASARSRKQATGDKKKYRSF